MASARNVKPRFRSPSRTKHTVAFGALLKELRGDRSVEQIVQRLDALRPPIDTDQATISGYEQGYIKKNPSPFVLWGLSRAYGVPHDGLLAVLLQNTKDSRLTLDAARQILNTYRHGPAPQMARTLKSIETRLVRTAGEIDNLRKGIHTDSGEDEPDRE